jgi:hypothetical protein
MKQGTRTHSVDPTVPADEPVHGEGDVVEHTHAPVAATSHPVDTERPASDENEGQIERDPSSEPVRRAASTGPGASTKWNAYPGLLPDDDLGGYQKRWDDIQGRFIDEPRQSVREADDLVGELTRRIVERFSSSRKDFDERWETDSEPTTEELRQALQRYRDYFKRLVAT